MSQTEQSNLTQVGVVSDFKTQGKKRMIVELNDRTIVIFLQDETFFALDSKCYHAGGPLHKGDIEDIKGYLCVKCPWHKRTICLKDGSDVLYNEDSDAIKLTENQQRTYPVLEKDGLLYIELTDLDGKKESDVFNRPKE